MEVTMKPSVLTRRRFTGSLGVAIGASFLAPRLAGAAAQPAAAPPVAGAPPAPSAAAPGAQPAPAAAASLPVRLDSNENPYGPAPAVLEAMEQARALGNRYPDDLETGMIDTLSRLHGVKPENIILGCGSGEVLRMADQAFTAPGKSVVAADPTFEAVLSFARVTRAEATKVPLTADYRHDLKAMAAACDAKTGLVYVCNPNNPTGTIVRRGELAAFLDAVPGPTVVMVDEAYHHFVEDARYSSALDLLADHPNLLVTRTFSKIYGLAGMRLGYGVASEATIAAMQPYRLWSNANAVVIKAALAGLADPDLVPHQRRLLNDTRRWLCAELEKDGRTYIPSEANFMMIAVGGDVGPLVEAFRARQIWVGRRFAAMPEWLRITIGTREEMAAFLDALRALVPAGAPATARIAPLPGARRAPGGAVSAAAAACAAA
jgi:histidinol-phosphate aminotransferase